MSTLITLARAKPGRSAFSDAARQRDEIEGTRICHDASDILVGVLQSSPTTDEETAEVLTDIARRIRRALHADRGTVAYRAGRGNWRLHHAEVPRRTQTMHDPNVTDHTEIQITLASADPVDITRLSGCTSHICVFMRDATGETLGLLSVQSILQRTFSRHDSALLNALADIAAVQLSQWSAMREPF